MAARAPSPFPSTGHVPDECGIVIFGASGDLTRRKLLPALYNLCIDRLLPPQFTIIGFARSELSDEAFAQSAQQAIREFSRQRPSEGTGWPCFVNRLHYHRGSYDDLDSFRRLKELQRKLDQERGAPGNWLYYMATPPQAYEPIAASLKNAGLVYPDPDCKPWSRLVVEKPIGTDYPSALALNTALGRSFHESQIYRIDHYLGKETVQNLMVLRFANGTFEPVWNASHVDHVQISVAETDGVGERGGYYEGAGAMRDMVQNHLLQLLCLIAMEPPHSLRADAIRDEKLVVFESLRPIVGSEVSRCVVRGQYDAGLIEGGPVKPYRAEAMVDPQSNTETFVALKVYLDSWRWSGVPFYLRTGKRLAKRSAEISIEFKNVPPILFNRAPVHPLSPNILTIRIQPNEGVALQINAKEPGQRGDIRPVKLDFGYQTEFPAGTPEAYERLLLDVTLGDATLFMRRDQVEHAWAFVSPILEAWASRPPDDFPNYMAGSAGPSTADELLVRDGRRWRRL